MVTDDKGIQEWEFHGFGGIKRSNIARLQVVIRGNPVIISQYQTSSLLRIIGRVFGEGTYVRGLNPRQ